MFLRLTYLFNSKWIVNFWICSSVQIINSVPSSRLLKYSSSQIRVPSESKNKWSLSALITGQMKKVVYIFHGNGDSFNMMIFITIIQPKIHKYHLYFKLFFTSKYFLSGHNSKKKLRIFFQKQSHIFSFNSFQKQSLISFQKQPHVP